MDILVTIVCFILICTTSTKGTPTIDLGTGNTVVPDDSRWITGTTTTCFSSTPIFTWELVSEDGRSSLSQVQGGSVDAVSEGSCDRRSSLYVGSVTVSYVKAEFVAVFGHTVKIRLTINNNPRISTTSSGTLSFIVHYSLTGSSQAATLGQQFTWTCHRKPNPNDTVPGVKFFRNEIEVGILLAVSSECKIEIRDTRYNFSCISETEYTLTIPSQNMAEYERNSIWRCEYFSGQSAYSSVQKRLTIAIDVSSVALEPPDNPLTLTEGSDREVRCTVNPNAFPTPTYAWFIDTKNITSTAGSDTSSIIITGSKTDNGKVLRCQATNNNRSKNGSTVLNITYKPTTSVTPSSPYQIREGDTAVISCVVTYANPNTGITWSWTKTGNPAVLYTGQNYTIPNIQRGQRGTYQCTATNYIGTSLPATVQVDVQYKPTISVTPSSPYQIGEGDTAVMYCVVTNANPNTAITWRWTKTGIPAVLYSGQNYTVPNIKRGQRGTYQCTATNPIGTSLPVTVQVDVQYKPTISVTPSSPYQIREGDTAVISCVVTDANPNTGITWSWTKTGNTTVLYSGQNYTITNIQKGQRGTYQCTATNSIGTSLPATVQVDVQYDNVITSNLSERYIISEHGRLEIKCDVDGNPLSTITWLFVPNNTVVKTDSDVSSSSLDILSANCLDHGSYKVIAENGKGPADIKNIHVAVRCKPRLYNIDSQSPDKVVIEHFDSLQILVRILLYPPATSTQWIFTGRNYTSKVIPNNTDGYRITNTKGEIEQNITLNKSRINEKDFGEYIIMVQNAIGTFLRIYHVDTAKFPGIQESVGNQTGVAVGSAAGVVTFIIIILVLVICLRRLYTFTCIIKLERKNINKGVKRTDLTKDESSIPMAEHTVHLHGERGVYEELTETDNGNQYEGLSTKDPQETERQTYESIHECSVQNKYEKLSTVPKKEDDDDNYQNSSKPKTSSPSDVYLNASFQN